MPEQRLLIDSDVLILLSGGGLLQEALDALGFRRDQARRLAALPHMLDRSKSLAAKYPVAFRQRARAECLGVDVVVDVPEAATLTALASLPEIDPGKAVLLGLVGEHRSWILTTGDKRAVSALGAAPGLAGIARAAAGKIVPFESVLRLLVRRLGAARVGDAFGPACNTHHTLSVVFSDVNRGDDARCLAAIDSYIREFSGRPGVRNLLRLDE